mmetsp:Transcript_85714/g.239596  ORF Transcript_85714/g.239596 Transcript_85714/m.239596 type:complete len:420 (-) Transcript_85714:25-1284(-)
MRDLEQLRTLHIQRLHEGAAELDHRLGREEPLAHASDFDHRLSDLHRVLEELVAIVPELRRHQVVEALHVRPDEELVLHDNRNSELFFLVLRDVLGQSLHRLVVGSTRDHAPAFRRGGEQLWAIFQSGGFVNVVSHELESLDHDAIRRVVFRALVIANEGHRHDKQEEEEKGAKNHEMVLLLEEEPRQTDADLCRLRPIGVPILLVILLGDLVGQRRISLGDLDEFRRGQGVVWVLVRVVDQRKLPVRFLDLGLQGRRRHLEDVEGVEFLDLRLTAEAHHSHGDEKPSQGEKRHLQHRATRGAARAAPCVPSRGVDLLGHLGGGAVLIDATSLALFREVVLNLRFPREKHVIDHGERPWNRYAKHHAAREVVESRVIVAEEALFIFLGEGVAEPRHGRIRTVQVVGLFTGALTATRACP